MFKNKIHIKFNKAIVNNKTFEFIYFYKGHNRPMGVYFQKVLFLFRAFKIFNTL